jgi:small subunit ribosomal protein S5
VRDILTKSLGSANPVNLLRATLNGLQEVRPIAQVEALRGVKLT